MGSKRAIVLVLRVVPVLALVAARPAHGQSGQKPCGLVSKEQVSAAVGAQVKAGEPIGTTGCHWSTDPNAKTRVMVTLSIWGEKMFPKGGTPGLKVTPASGGLGDEAVFDTLGDLTALFVKKGKSTLQIRVYGLHDTAKQEQIETSIAKHALARW